MQIFRVKQHLNNSYMVQNEMTVMFTAVFDLHHGLVPPNYVSQSARHTLSSIMLAIISCPLHQQPNSSTILESVQL